MTLNTFKSQLVPQITDANYFSLKSLSTFKLQLFLNHFSSNGKRIKRKVQLRQPKQKDVKQKGFSF
jgi:hypothetical protein